MAWTSVLFNDSQRNYKLVISGGLFENIGIGIGVLWFFFSLSPPIHIATTAPFIYRRLFHFICFIFVSTLVLCLDASFGVLCAFSSSGHCRIMLFYSDKANSTFVAIKKCSLFSGVLPSFFCTFRFACPPDFCIRHIELVVWTMAIEWA